MQQVRKTALVWRPAPMMFDLIERAEDYRESLPWCAGATLHERSNEVVAADIHVDYRGVRFSVGTRNPKRRPEHMAIHLVRGPFRHFEGQWSLRALSPEACKIEFELRYAFDSALMTRLAGPAFGHIADTLMDAFVRRAMSLPVPPPAREPDADRPAAAATAPTAVAPVAAVPAAGVPAAGGPADISRVPAADAAGVSGPPAAPPAAADGSGRDAPG